jgi:hypothetical protein
MRLGHLDMLPEKAFKPIGKRMTLEGGGGKGGDAPKAPDYTKLAQQQAALQGQLIDQTTLANRVNQYTPFGSLEFTRSGGSPTFDQAGYDKAMRDYNQRVSASSRAQSGPLHAFWQIDQMYNKNSPYGSASANAGAYGGGVGAAPTREQFMRGGSTSGQWSATTKLSPEMQAILNQNIASKGESYKQLMTSLGNINNNNLPLAPVNAGETAQDAILRRVNPQLNIQEDQLRTRLVNQGLRPGTEAWNREYELFGRQRNDAVSQAALAGINVGNEARARALSEQGIPINLINAYLSGGQAQMPQFQNYAQQANQSAPDLLGAGQSQYNAGLNAYNASQAQGANTMNGLFGLAGAIGGAPSGSLFGNVGGAIGRVFGF